MRNKNKVFGFEHNPNTRVMPKMFGMDHTPNNFRSSVYIETEEQDALATFKFDLIHRDDGPAWIDEMSKEYYQFGYRHQVFVPAVAEWVTAAGHTYLKKQSRFLFGDLHTPVDNKPALIYYYPDGLIKNKKFFKFNLDHRKDGPAMIAYNTNGDITHEEYYQFGLKHHNTEAADILTSDFEKSIKFYKFGLFHNEDGPASIVKNIDNSIKVYANYKFDCLHSEKDTITKVSESDDIKHIQYYRFNQLHRLNGPADINHRKKYTTKKYYKLGLKSRIEGPAIIEYKDGIALTEHHRFFIGGYEIQKDDFYEMTLEERQQREFETFKRVIRVKLINDFKVYVLTGAIADRNISDIDILSILDCPNENCEITLSDDFETIEISSSGEYGKCSEKDDFTYKTIWRFKGLKLHNDNGPAYEKVVYDKDGNEFKSTQIWSQFGVIHRDGQPAIIVNDVDNSILMHCQFGYLHRDNGPALCKYKINEETLSKYYRFGLLHRDNNLPAVLSNKFNTEGKNIFHHKIYYQFGKKHLGNGPAEFINDSTTPGVVKETEIFYKHGLIHQDDGRAAWTLVHKNSNGDKIYEELHWKRFGCTHNDGGPASIIIRYSGSKKIRHVKYYQFDEIHRDEGPAEIIEIKDDSREKIVSIFRKFNKIHRDFGPAILSTTNPDIKPVYLMGVKITKSNVLEYFPDILKYYDILGKPIPYDIKQLVPKKVQGQDIM